MANQTGSVYLVGAGLRAAPSLITLGDWSCCGAARPWYTNDLIDNALLDAAPPQAERVYMGKRSGRHSAHQEEICNELIRQARMGRLWCA